VGVVVGWGAPADATAVVSSATGDFLRTGVAPGCEVAGCAMLGCGKSSRPATSTRMAARAAILMAFCAGIGDLLT
jgi:hypothetical protein